MKMEEATCVEGTVCAPPPAGQDRAAAVIWGGDGRGKGHREKLILNLRFLKHCGWSSK